MGTPIIVPELIPVVSDRERIVAMPITVGGISYEMTCVSMGNPHAIVFVDNTKSIDIEK